ncbi:hypothetical protein V6K52_17625 [Knoellia sp. S7-12]|uniref:hypothetical protein n=1 Tax=Knoellia sp. S7-12 TaxID=3126698 RepID=UPI003368FF45
MARNIESGDPVLRDTGVVLAVGGIVLLVLIFTGLWSTRTWWSSAMDLSGNSATKTVLILVLAPLVASGTLMMALRGEEAWTSRRKWRTALYVGLTVLAFAGCVVLPGTAAGRTLIQTYAEDI